MRGEGARLSSLAKAEFSRIAMLTDVGCLFFVVVVVLGGGLSSAFSTCSMLHHFMFPSFPRCTNPVSATDNDVQP